MINGENIQKGRMITALPSFFSSLSLRGKSSLLLIPIIIFISAAFTAQAIRTERLLLRQEMIRRGETIALIAARNAELPIISENFELLTRSARSLKGINDVEFVTFFKKDFSPLIHEGANQQKPLPKALNPDLAVQFYEHDGHFEFFVPIFTEKGGGDFEFFTDTSPVREHIGWALIGVSKRVIAEGTQKIIYKSILFALFSTAGGALLMYALIAIALRPISILLQAVKGIRDGEYKEIPLITPKDEIGRLTAEFNRMSRAVQEREERINDMMAEIQDRNRDLDVQVKKRTEQLEQAYTELKKVDEIKTSFLVTVSHELRTPLTSVLGFAEISHMKFIRIVKPAVSCDEPKVQEAIEQIDRHLHIIVAEGQRMTNMINEFLDLSKLEAGKVEWNMMSHNIKDIIDQAAAATSSLFEQKGLQYQEEIEEGLPEPVVDRDRLIQVLINLISNAIKFSDSGRVTCRVCRNIDKLTISIIDEGIGIASEDQKNIFEKFRQVQMGGDKLTDRPQGTGLGLSICKQIVESHGGKIWVESTKTAGSTFSFTIPIMPVQTPLS